MAGRSEGTGAGMGKGTPPALPVSEEEGSVPEQLGALRAETHEILELVRSLVSLLLPKGDDDGPKLEDLIAALVAQQRDILIAVRQIPGRPTRSFLERSGGAKPKSPGAPGPSNGGARA